VSIADVIREASTKHEIRFLLTAYIQSVRYAGKLSLLPAAVSKLPLAGPDDVRERVRMLTIEQNTAWKRLNARGCLAIEEALQVFGAAQARLNLLETACSPPPPTVVQAGLADSPLHVIPPMGKANPRPDQLHA